MRSHITNLSSEMMNEKKEKLSSSLNNGGDKDSEAAAATNAAASYGLRENPKKTWRISDYSSEDPLVFDKFCKECGKGFHSWKALFGHMKCHSEKERVSNSLEDQDSWTNSAKMVMDSQSDNEATAPNKRRRSKRRTRYTVVASSAAAATTSSVVSFANPSSSSLSEVEQEQEEVAMSLMMLSRDVSPWSGRHSVAESSDNNSAYFEARSSVRTNLVTKFDCSNKNFPPKTAKVTKQSDNKWEVGNSENPNSIRGTSSQLLTTIAASDNITTEIPENGFRVNKSRVSNKGYERAKSELEYVSALEDSEGEHGRSRVNGTESVLSKSVTTTGNKYSSIKTKFSGSEMKSNKNLVDKASEAESSKNSNKRGKFECTTCNKIFHSYQALGGHRASHKKIKGCFASTNESSENSIETDPSPDPIATENKLMKNSDSEYLVEHQHGASLHNEGETVNESKKSKGHHECPICFKVFPSGQALGGHKRSHMVGGSESRNFQTIVPQEPVAEIRDFLDLNLPASTEEESYSHADSNSNRPWWIVEDNHKQEALVGLIS